MIKLIVSDIDGTLLEDGGHELNPALFPVILKLREQGVQFAAASGRQWVSIEKVFSPIKEKIFYLSDNGAYVGCHGRQLFVNSMNREQALMLVRDIQAEGLDAMVSGPDVIYLKRGQGAGGNSDLYHWLVDGYKFRIEEVDDLAQVQDDIIKVSAYKPSGIEAATVRLRDKYQDQMKMTISGDMWLDCMRQGVNKGEAVKLLQESLGIQPTETMVFGDQLNDMEMLQQAYYSFAIGNARSEIKAAARFEADTCTRDGVLKILQLLL